MKHGYTLAELRDGTGFDKSARFVQVDTHKEYILRTALERIAGTGHTDDGAQEAICVAEAALAEADKPTRDEEKAAGLAETGRCAFAALAEMVAALECDYERLDELKQDRDEWNARYKEGNEQTDYENGSLDADELKELESAAGDCKDRDDAEQRIHEDPLSIEVRGDWHTPGASDEYSREDNAPSEFRILLGTGGPAIRIIGELNAHGEPTSATLQTQDWGTPWTDYRGGDEETLLTYCRCFYFGEG